jgi:hypothetical protein
MVHEVAAGDVRMQAVALHVPQGLGLVRQHDPLGVVEALLDEEDPARADGGAREASSSGVSGSDENSVPACSTYHPTIPSSARPVAATASDIVAVIGERIVAWERRAR